MRQLPWSLVLNTFLELRRLMQAGRLCQAGAGLLGLFASTFFRPFEMAFRHSCLKKIEEPFGEKICTKIEK